MIPISQDSQQSREKLMMNNINSSVLHNYSFNSILSDFYTDSFANGFD
jgi:hypothetical protein